MGPVNYRLQQPRWHSETQLYQINLLKKWVEPTPVVSTFAALPTDLHERTLVHHGEDFTPMQRQELMELVYQFTNVFTSIP